MKGQLFFLHSNRGVRSWTKAVVSLCLVFLGFMGLGANAVAATPGEQRQALEQAAKQLREGHADNALKLLQPIQHSLAGLPAFDFLFGRIALETDKPTEAVFAFDRCLAMEPSHEGCRLGMARAHIQLHERASARQELESLSRSGVSDSAQQLIDRYLGQAAPVTSGKQDMGRRLSAYIQLGLGYDSNINNGTTRDSMIMPAFDDDPVAISRDSQRQESGFFEGRFNLSYSAPISDKWRLSAEGNVFARSNTSTHRHDSLMTDVRLGLNRQSGPHDFGIKIMGQHYRLHERTYRNLASLQTRYSYEITPRSKWLVFAQASHLRYPQNRLRDAHRYTLGASWIQRSSKRRVVGYLTGYGGTQRTIRSHAPRVYSHHLVGARAGAIMTLAPKLMFELGAGAERRRYRGQHHYFLASRRDTYYDLRAGFRYAINRKLSLRPEYRYLHNQSSIGPYRYKRHIFTVNLRYELF